MYNYVIEPSHLVKDWHWDPYDWNSAQDSHSSADARVPVLIPVNTTNTISMIFCAIMMLTRPLLDHLWFNLCTWLYMCIYVNIYIYINLELPREFKFFFPIGNTADGRTHTNTLVRFFCPLEKLLFVCALPSAVFPLEKKNLPKNTPSLCIRMCVHLHVYMHAYVDMYLYI